MHEESNRPKVCLIMGKDSPISSERVLTEIHESDSCGTYSGFRVSSSCERLYPGRPTLEALDMLQYFIGGWDQLVYTSVKKKTDISTVRWLLLWREILSRSIGCKQPSRTAR